MSPPSTQTGGNAVVHWNTVATEAFTPSKGRTRWRSRAPSPSCTRRSTTRSTRSTAATVLHPGLARGADGLGRRGGRRSGARRARRASARPGGAGRGGLRPCALAVSRRACQDRRHCDRPGRRAATMNRRQGDGSEEAHAAGLRAALRARRVPVHAAVRLRRAAGLGPRDSPSSSTFASTPSTGRSACPARSTRATWRT